jgi:hypothetical protein
MIQNPLSDMQIDPAIFMLEGQRKQMLRGCESLERYMRDGGCVDFQDGGWIVAEKSGEVVAGADSLWLLIFALGAAP